MKLVDFRFIPILAIIESGGETQKFNYANWQSDPSPLILRLGKYVHQTTGNLLVGGINLNYLSDSEVNKLRQYLPQILESPNLRDRYWAGRNLFPEVFNNYYRTYRADLMGSGEGDTGKEPGEGGARGTLPFLTPKDLSSLGDFNKETRVQAKQIANNNLAPTDPEALGALGGPRTGAGRGARPKTPETSGMPSTRQPERQVDPEQAAREKAYYNWLNRGKPEGDEMTDWNYATQKVEQPMPSNEISIDREIPPSEQSIEQPEEQSTDILQVAGKQPSSILKSMPDQIDQAQNSIEQEASTAKELVDRLRNEPPTLQRNTKPVPTAPAKQQMRSSKLSIGDRIDDRVQKMAEKPQEQSMKGSGPVPNLKDEDPSNTDMAPIPAN